MYRLSITNVVWLFLLQICTVVLCESDVRDNDCDIHELYADCSLRGLKDIPHHLPPNITCLNMAGNDVNKINGTLWQRYPCLQKLSFANNSIEEIDDNSFTFLENLQMLDISLNMIKYNRVSENAFKPFKNLIYLDIKQSLTSIFPDEMYPRSLVQIRQLKTLMIDGLGQQQLPVLPHLTNLYFSGQYGRCNIINFKNSIIHNVKHVERLYLSNCSIISVEHGLLKKFPNITSLDLSWNLKLGFSSIYNICFGIENNAIFKRLNLNNVQEHGTGCKTLTIHDLQLLKRTNLEFLSLNGNSMWGLETHAVFYFPKSLKYLCLSDNILMIGQYAYEISKSEVFRNIVYYDSSQQFRSHLPEFFNMSDIAGKVEVGTDSKHVPKVLNNVLCENMFTRSIFKDYFEVIDGRITQFNITSYGFDRELVNSYGTNLEYLDLSDNAPGTVEFALIMFQHSPLVKFLNLSNNHFGYTNLTGKEIFLHFTSLRFLDLSYNRIEMIQNNVFRNCVHLEGLYLSRNKLTDVPLKISTMPKLKYIDLGFNYINTLSEISMDTIDKMENLTINLFGNRLTCFCSNIKFVGWMMENSNKLEHFNETNCYLDDSGREVALGELNWEHLQLKCNPPTYFALILGLSLGIVTFIIIVSCGVVYRFKWNFRYLYYMTKMKLIGTYQPLEGREYEKEVFVSYAKEDHDFVTQHIIPELEVKGGISLLVHERDFVAGEFVADNIMKAITSTRKTLVVLTSAFIHSKWCMYELNIARIEGADTGRNVLCIILKENVPTKYLPIEVIDIIKNKTYLEYPEEKEHVNRFWERLRETLSLQKK